MGAGTIAPGGNLHTEAMAVKPGNGQFVYDILSQGLPIFDRIGEAAKFMGQPAEVVNLNHRGRFL